MKEILAVPEGQLVVRQHVRSLPPLRNPVIPRHGISAGWGTRGKTAMGDERRRIGGMTCGFWRLGGITGVGRCPGEGHLPQLPQPQQLAPAKQGMEK